ncbi:uncharacterized protein LOC117044552 [Lacerta agilis]|uniref:uncharacterized protein LOC117044552 n=1 Tax=Lacerta agilis TaxID=80427 RepID=UPI00141A400D|nr:uncharacterized protein LOC117044552 [Lacerta agilis]
MPPRKVLQQDDNVSKQVLPRTFYCSYNKSDPLRKRVRCTRPPNQLQLQNLTLPGQLAHEVDGGSRFRRRNQKRWHAIRPVADGEIKPAISALSALCSNQLSYPAGNLNERGSYSRCAGTPRQRSCLCTESKAGGLVPGREPSSHCRPLRPCSAASLHIFFPTWAAAHKLPSALHSSGGSESLLFFSGLPRNFLPAVGLASVVSAGRGGRYQARRSSRRRQLAPTPSPAAWQSRASPSLQASPPAALRGGGDTEGRLHLLPLPPRPSRTPSLGSLPRRRRGAAAAAREQKRASERKADSPVASNSHLPGQSRGPTAHREE